MPLPTSLQLLRPKQWTKGFLVFAALLFTKGYLYPAKIGSSLIAFAAMALVSSAVYVINDIIDIERDRNHPTKNTRPLAAGSISVQIAWVLCLLCLISGIGLSLVLGVGSITIILSYLVLQVLYNGYFKRVPVADVFCLSLGFVLRASLGAAAIHAYISGWLLYCTGALAMLLAFGKRRHEFILKGEQRNECRESLSGYTQQSLDAMLMVAAASAALSYGIYSLESPTAKQYPALIVTSIFVFYGIYRYLFLVLTQGEGGEPENLLLRDKHIIASVICFVASAAVALGGLRIPFIEGS